MYRFSATCRSQCIIILPKNTGIVHVSYFIVFIIILLYSLYCQTFIFILRDSVNESDGKYCWENLQMLMCESNVSRMVVILYHGSFDQK